MTVCNNQQLDISNSQEYQLVVNATSKEILDVTAAAAHLYGYEVMDLLGLKITELCPDFVPSCESKGVHCHRNKTTFYALTCCFEVSLCHQHLLLLTIKPIAESPISQQNSLITLISGFAHELNTPTGNVLMAASTLGSFVDQIEQALDNRSLTALQLKELLAGVTAAQQHVQSSTRRISELVEQVKRIAVSWVLESIVSFNVHDYALHIFKQFGQRLQAQNIQYHLDCPRELMIAHDSAAFIQIIEQLVENSLYHAFDDNGGNIYLTICQQDDNLVIDYRDDGKGISQQSNKHIFDLFYSSGRSRGLVGLGLNMVFNIVSLRLKGQIQSFAQQGGCYFMITFPLLAQHQRVKQDNNNVTEF